MGDVKRPQRRDANTAIRQLDSVARAIHRFHSPMGTYDSCDKVICRQNARAFWGAYDLLEES